jgi:hypothetical protein
MADITSSSPIQITLATDADREAIYRLRHLVFAEELHQHPANTEQRLTDYTDAHNLYILAKLDDAIVGCISVTPPGHKYSIDKYLSRAELPFPCDDGLYEVRLLTILPGYRHSVIGGELAGLLIYATFRWVDHLGGRRLVAIGRREVLGLYRKIGFEPLGREIRCGAVTFELISTSLDNARQRLESYLPLVRYVQPHVDWRLGIPYLPAPC